ncbi:MAG TPA: polyribonucleotide nucleotidyltransferase [Candidatus Paceibacterota bacterium]
MKETVYTFTHPLLGTSPLTVTFTDLANQADSNILISHNDTVLHVAVCTGDDAEKNPGYLNLTVEYQERYYAAGKILGARYTRREGAPSTRSIIVSRIIDRTIRPLIPSHIKNSMQLVITALSLGETDPSILGVIGASIALTHSSIPFNGPVSALSMIQTAPDAPKIYFARKPEGTDAWHIDSIICGNEQGIDMIEASFKELTEKEVAAIITESEKFIEELNKWQLTLPNLSQKMKFAEAPTDERITKFFEDQGRTMIVEHLFANFELTTKARIKNLTKEVLAAFEESVGVEEFPLLKRSFLDVLDTEMDVALHEQGINNKKRSDGRNLNTVRPLFAKAGAGLPRVHGSGIFYRGETHVLATATLAGPEGYLFEEHMEQQQDKRFFLHYNFPPFSVGETGRMGGINRRSTGHGMLAEKALLAVIPTELEFPYTIRVVSECLASNGSTSQGTICAGTLALMDAGVPISAPVVGISIGLLYENPNKYVLLTDIQGPEDHHGDMDFKIAGTKNGITAIQLDIKLSGISSKILIEALSESRTAHTTLLKSITDVISEPRAQLSEYAPRIEVLQVAEEKIGKVIGPKGETIQNLQKETQTIITVKDDGTVIISGSQDGAKAARSFIETLTKEWKIGDRTEGVIVKILDEIGAIVEFAKGVDGMVHISEIGNFRVRAVSDVLKQGMTVPVTIINIDRERGKISLSIKKDNPEFIKISEVPQAAQAPRNAPQKPTQRERLQEEE